jgi:hypothetical protein
LRSGLILPARPPAWAAVGETELIGRQPRRADALSVLFKPDFHRIVTTVLNQQLRYIFFTLFFFTTLTHFVYPDGANLPAVSDT